jgi:dynein heavy chain
LEGLPSDDLSIQNGIMVTRSSRFPLMVDPQGQANRWVKSREAERIERSPRNTVTTLAAKNLKDQLEFTMGEGLCLIIENVENELDPLLDPVLEKAIIKKGKNLYINVSDQNMDYSPKFCLYMTSRLPNPHFARAERKVYCHRLHGDSERAGAAAARPGDRNGTAIA